MRALRALPAAALTVAVLVVAGTAAALAGMTAARAAGPPAAGPGCSFSPASANTWAVQCQNVSTAPGATGTGGSGPGGSGGSGSYRPACALNSLSPGQARNLGLATPPKGETWASVVCPGRNTFGPFGAITLIAAKGAAKGGGPAVTPQELLQIAIGELKIPALRPGTAPPLGHDGLVGLPEWFWVPAGQWHPVSVTVAVGAVWAQVTATPQRLGFFPGSGLTGTSCAGPGTAYTPAAATGCQYTYGQSSALQPGGAYHASVAVTWRVTWTGSGGTGGVVDAAQQVGYPVALRVAEAQALVRGQ